MGKVLSIANQKGGTGKTTTAINLGAGLAALGRRVLLIDLDPQSSLTLATVGECAASMADVLGDAKAGKLAMRDIITPLGDRLDLAPGDIALSNSELGFGVRMMRETILKLALRGLDYDAIVIDCGPSLGLLTVNAMAASDGVLCPTLPTALDLRGLRLFLDSLALIREGLNPGLELIGVLVTQYSGRLTLHRDALADLQAGNVPVLPVMIGKSIKAAEATGAGEALDRGALAEQYKELAEIVNRWLTEKRD